MPSGARSSTPHTSGSSSIWPRPGRVVPELVGDPLDLGLGQVEVGAVGDRRRRAAPGPTAGTCCRPAAIVPLGTCQTVPFTIAQPGGAQRHRLDRAVTGCRWLADVDDVADAVLVLDEHEDAGEEVLHQALGAEADGDAGDAGAGDERARG